MSCTSGPGLARTGEPLGRTGIPGAVAVLDGGALPGTTVMDSLTFHDSDRPGITRMGQEWCPEPCQASGCGNTCGGFLGHPGSTHKCLAHA